MEKAAINAVSLRRLVVSLPRRESIKRFGKKRVDKINAEIENAVNRYYADKKSVNPDYAAVIHDWLPGYVNSGSKLDDAPFWGSMAKNVPLAQQDYSDAWARYYRRYFKNLFFNQNEFMTRDQLLRNAKRYGVDLNPNDLKHDVYHNVLGAPLDVAAQAGTTGADIVRLNAQLPQTVGHLTNRLNTAVAGETRRPLMSYIRTNETLGDNPKRSIRNALDIVRNQNVLEPGTRANRLYKRVVHGAKSSEGLERVLRNIFSREELHKAVETGDNASFNPTVNAIFVAPSGKFAGKNTVLHESSHMRWHNLSPERRFEMARHYLTRLNRSAIRHNLNIPWNNTRYMQEYLADAAAPALNTLGFINTFKRPTLSLSNAIPAARINLLDAPDDVRRGLLQLQMNYHHPVFKVQDSVRRNLP